ncbi:MAG: hypothetical protein JKY67_14010 [Pseudomonadales bacterium]|nr:hypothetical protein [Pseudomonadales bacterium]
MLQKEKALTEVDFIKIGFRSGLEARIFRLTLDLGQGKYLSAGSIGTPNETIFLCELDTEGSSIVPEAICIHNYDYHGYVSREKLERLIFALK